MTFSLPIAERVGRTVTTDNGGSWSPMRPERVRFGFRIDGGPNDGLCCGGWRVWTHGDTTYITAKSLGDTWKTSLHGEGPWQHAVTKDHLRNAERPVWSEPDRAPWKFQPPPYVNGKRVAFVIAVTRAALLRGELDPSEHVITVDDRWDRLTSAFVWMTEPAVTLDEPGVFAGPLVLTTGCRVWLQQNQEALDAKNEPESPCVGAMIEPMSPETHDVLAPGFLLRGVRWG